MYSMPGVVEQEAIFQMLVNSYRHGGREPAALTYIVLLCIMRMKDTTQARLKMS